MEKHKERQSGGVLDGIACASVPSRAVYLEGKEGARSWALDVERWPGPGDGNREAEGKLAMRAN